MHLVSVITVNYNQPAVTEELLDSIARHNTYEPLEILVVDNGSRQDHTARWQAKYPYVRFIRSEENLGFAGGNNLGIREAKGRYLFFINNDTEITAGLIESLVNVLETSPSVGIVSPKIRYHSEPTRLQYAGYTPMNYFTARNRCIGLGEEDRGQYDAASGPTGYAHGAAMMVRRDALEAAGPMPQTYFLYYEEMDWCESFRRAGYQIHTQLSALIYHKESVSVGKASALKEYFMNRNRILFIRRNAPRLARLVFHLYFIAAVMPRNILAYLRAGKAGFIRILAKAVWWNLAHRKTSTDLGYRVR